jgi:hypothetical protein
VAYLVPAKCISIAKQLETATILLQLADKFRQQGKRLLESNLINSKMAQNLTSISNDTNVGSHDEAPGRSMENNTRNLNISPELFEKLYLRARQQNHISLSQTFGNPTPVAIMGLVVAITPLSIELMGWRGANGLLATK